MSEGTVRYWCKMFKHMLTMKSEVVGQPSIVSDDLIQTVDQNVCEINFGTFM
jgi:hypothetical protein